MKIFEHLQKPWFLDVNSNLFFIKIKDKWRDKITILNHCFKRLPQYLTVVVKLEPKLHIFLQLVRVSSQK